ncbi:MAG: BrnT family toxin, partial [Chloroflexota bacterium]|nr:BrnT family toxin [Chloroflexota bacterium]
DKRRANIEKHGLDFEEADVLFDGRPVFTTTSYRGDEVRYVTTAIYLERYVTVIWTPRDDKIRIISMRRTRHAEEREYRQVHG